MDSRHIQLLLASSGYYKGAIDGDLGPLTRKAVQTIERNAKESRGSWYWKRRMIAAAQAVLSAQGYEPGVVDGLYGHNTREALTAWLSAQAGVPSKVERKPVQAAPSPLSLPRQSELNSFYGTPGEGGTVNQRLVTVEVPYTMRLDYALDTKITRVTLHELCAPSFVSAQIDVVRHYGEAEWRRLGLDRYAGGYTPRRMRGGSNWSTHAYGCAADFYASPNGLRTRCPRALFCRDEYKPFLDIMQANNWLPAIRLWGADAMHFQQARL